jgi:hypothetical protein
MISMAREILNAARFFNLFRAVTLASAGLNTAVRQAQLYRTAEPVLSSDRVIGVTPFFRIMLPYLAVSPVIRIAKASLDLL